MDFACSNRSQESVTTELWVLSDDQQPYAYSVAAVLLIYILVGVPWNIMVLVIILKKRLYVQPTYMLLFNLSCTDLLNCLLQMPLGIVSALAGEFIFGDSDYIRCINCRIFGSILRLLLYLSVNYIALLSLDRFLYVKYPLKYEKIVTIKRTVAALIVCWLVTTVLTFLGIEFVKFNHYSALCHASYSSGDSYLQILYFWLLTIGLCCLPIPIIIVCNIGMLYIIRRNISRGYHRSILNNPSGYRRPSFILRMKEEKQHRQLRLTQIFGTIFIVNIIIWIPSSISLVLMGFVEVPAFFVLTHLCFLSQVVIHPFLQVFLLRDIRNEITHCCSSSSCVSDSPFPDENERGCSGRKCMDSILSGVLCNNPVCSCICMTINACGAAVVGHHSHDCQDTDPKSV